MKNLVVLALFAGLGGCATQGPYASTSTNGRFVMADRFHGEMRKCGPDKHVCFEMQRDDADRRAAGGTN